MQVILLERVGDLGNLGDILEVKNGYARNYLIPTGKAKRASKENIAEFEQKKAEFIAKQEAVINEAKEKQTKVNGQVIKILQKSGIDGRLFGSVTTIDIAKSLNDFGVSTERSCICLPHGPLKNVGEYDIEVVYHHDAVAVIKLVIEPQMD